MPSANRPFHTLSGFYPGIPENPRRLRGPVKYEIDSDTDTRSDLGPAARSAHVWAPRPLLSPGLNDSELSHHLLAAAVSNLVDTSAGGDS